MGEVPDVALRDALIVRKGVVFDVSKDDTVFVFKKDFFEFFSLQSTVDLGPDNLAEGAVGPE